MGGRRSELTTKPKFLIVGARRVGPASSTAFAVRDRSGANAAKFNTFPDASVLDRRQPAARRHLFRQQAR